MLYIVLAEFKRAVKVVTGQELSDNVLDTIFKIFDLDGDHCLSHEEFLGVLKNRMHRGLRVRNKRLKAFLLGVLDNLNCAALNK